jgi:hypothetical protein
VLLPWVRTGKYGGRGEQFPCDFLTLKQYTRIINYRQIVRLPARAKAGQVSEEGGRYLSYLLRLWEVQSKDGLVWRASLEHASTGERRGFACLADLYAFLEQETAPVDEDEPRPQPADQGEKIRK